MIANLIFTSASVANQHVVALPAASVPSQTRYVSAGRCVNPTLDDARGHSAHQICSQGRTGIPHHLVEFDQIPVEPHLNLRIENATSV